MSTASTHPSDRTATERRLIDTTIDVKVRLAGLWTSMLFLFAYVDIFGFFRSDVIEGALAGEVSGTGIAIGQTFLAATTVYIAIPCLMIVVSLTARARLNRTLHLVTAVVYATTIALSCIGETWVYYLLGSAIEVMILMAVVRTAWRWPAVASVSA